MRLFYYDLNLELNLQDDAPCILVVENVEVFSNIVKNFGEQITGNEGCFFLSDKDKEPRIERKVEFIINPHALTVNDKKTLSSIYSDMEIISNENYDQPLAKVNSEIVTYIDQVTQHLPYPLFYNLDLSPTDIFKLYNVKIEEEFSGITDKIISYIKLKHQVLGKCLFIFVNLKHFVSSQDLEYIYDACRYEQVYFLDLEGIMPKSTLKAEKYVIIDSDLCIINIK